MKRVRVVVIGRVQGVGYRYFAMERARDLQLTGFVRNLRNGGVEVVAEGEEGALEALVAGLQSGPTMSSVDKAHIVWLQYENTFQNFSIYQTK